MVSRTSDGESESICEVIVERLAEKEDVDTTALQPPLYEVVDPDALETLFNSKYPKHNENLEVAFDYGEYTVRLEQGSGIEIQPKSITREE